MNRPPEHLLLVALDLPAEDARDALGQLRGILQDELTSELDPLGDPGQSPAETGELGFAPDHDRAHLTVTVGISSSGYAKLGVPPEQQPQDLVAMPWGALGETPANPAGGDVILQIRSDSAYIAEHVLRRAEHELAAEVTIVWAHTGIQRYTTRAGRVASNEARSWIGFLDGTSNLDPAHNDDDLGLTLVDPDNCSSYPPLPPPDAPNQYGQPEPPTFPSDLRPPPTSEPEWTRNGTYLSVRISTNDLAHWDAATLATQQTTIGRTKDTGVSLDLVGQSGATADSVPAFADNPADLAVGLQAHIRKANPRGPSDTDRRIYRRGYPLYEGADGDLRRGLMFLAYGRTISTQFEFIFRGWLTNDNFPAPGTGPDLLRSFDTQVLAGGYYFMPPLEKPHQPWSWYVPPAST